MTTTSRWLGFGLTLLLGACGGGGSSHDNVAATTTFAYGSTQPASSAQAGAMGSTVASLEAFRVAPGTSSGLGAADGGSVTGTVLQGDTLGSFSPGQVGATSGATFDVPACAAVATGQVTFSGCRVTVNETSATSTINGAVTVNGHVSVATDQQTITWELTYGIDLTVTDTASLRVSGHLHTAGQVVVTATTAVGTATTEVSLTASSGGQSASAALDESLAFDVTRASTCASGVTGGTLEAKRVWVTRPSGASATDLPDEAAKIAWTGCGVATIRAGTR
jgi:hypothetical protein